MPSVEPVDRLVRADQRVLDEVLGVGVVARERPGDAQHHLDLGQHELLECRVTTRFGHR